MIYNQPNHPFYGPVRRMHLKLMELFGADVGCVEEMYEKGIGADWTLVMASSLAQGVREPHVARSTLKTMLNLYDTLQCQMIADTIPQRPGPCRSALRPGVRGRSR